MHPMATQRFTSWRAGSLAIGCLVCYSDKAACKRRKACYQSANQPGYQHKHKGTIVV